MGVQKSYQGKYFSVFGDSISTLDGYSAPQEAAFYEGMMKLEADVFVPEETWWGRVIAALGGTLLVNNSFSGCTVCKHPDCMIPSYGCSDERTAALGREGISPDVILLFMGINDWGHGLKPAPICESEGRDLSVFSVAFDSMLEKLRKNYPQGEIWCCTLPVSTCTRWEEFAFPYSFGGVHIERYNEQIRACAERYGCRLLELYHEADAHDTVDGFHPTAKGMKTLADRIMQQL